MATLLTCIMVSGTDAAVNLRLSTSATDANAGNSLNLQLGQSGSMFVWASTSAGQTITGLSLNIESSDTSTLQATNHTTQNPGNTRWQIPTGEGTLGDLVTGTNSFVLFGQSGLSTANETTFALHSEIQFDATALGTTNLSITRGQFDIVEGAGFVTIPDTEITFGTGAVTVASATVIPEPGSAGLVSLGFGGLLMRFRRRRS